MNTLGVGASVERLVRRAVRVGLKLDDFNGGFLLHGRSFPVLLGDLLLR